MVTMSRSLHDARGPAAPQPDVWEFGGSHPYGLEPLVLTDRWSPPSPAAPAELGALREAESAWMKPRDAPAMLEHIKARDETTVNRLFWFRWIVGHQLTFILWQLLAGVLAEAAARPEDSDQLAEQATLLVRGYSLMLLYSSSPPRRIYDPVIRSVMARQHVHLSGAWARDFGPVRGVFRGRVPVDDAALLRECAVNERVHECIVEKLTPGTPSLLQTATGTGPRHWRNAELLTLYDCIFLTLRSPTSHPRMVIQLLRRLRCVDQDLAANALYPDVASSLDEEPAEMKGRDITDLKNRFSESLRQIARFAVRSCTELKELQD